MIKQVVLTGTFCMVCGILFSQQTLPLKNYLALRDSTNSIDVVILQGKGASINFEGRNVSYFNSMIENKTAAKSKAPLGGTIMWLIDGREFISGNYFLGDSTGYVVMQKDGKEYVNQLNKAGISFLKSEIKY